MRFLGTSGALRSRSNGEPASKSQGVADPAVPRIAASSPRQLVAPIEALGPPGVAPRKARPGENGRNPKQHKEPDDAQRVATLQAADDHKGRRDDPDI